MTKALVIKELRESVGIAVLAFPGNHASPFYWSMTLPAWKLWYTIPVGYLGAFLSGIRPGRWFGSRLAPLVTSIGVGVGTYFIPWWWPGLIAYWLEHRRAVLEPCPECGATVPRDREACADCGTAFPPPALVGTEILA